RDVVGVTRNGAPRLPATGVGNGKLGDDRTRRAAKPHLDQPGDARPGARRDPRPEGPGRRGAEVDVRVHRPVAIRDPADVLPAADIARRLDLDAVLLRVVLGLDSGVRA